MRISIGLTVFLVWSLSGCEKSNPQITGAQLRGKITMKSGGPVTGGDVRVIALDDPSRSQSGFLRADGNYEVLNAPTGDVKLVLDTLAVKSHPASMPGADSGTAEQLYGGKLKYIPLRPEYADPAKTPLKATIHPGDNVQDFVVE